jgi:hypothetical protein
MLLMIFQLPIKKKKVTKSNTNYFRVFVSNLVNWLLGLFCLVKLLCHL